MPDIELRLGKDMLVLSAPIDETLKRQGVDAARDRQYLNLFEPDIVHDALNLEVIAGAQCLVTTTEDITKARLAHVRMDSDQARLAKAALNIAAELKPQHVLVEIGPCDLPLDVSSKASLNESRAQYANAARAFGEAAFDAFFLNGFTNIVDMKCALMGVAQVSGKPVFASMTVGTAADDPAHGRPIGSQAANSESTSSKPERNPLGQTSFGMFDELEAPAFSGRTNRTPLAPEDWPAAVEAMVDLGAAVIGFETADPIARAVEYAAQAAAATQAPILAQLRVAHGSRPKAIDALTPLASIDAYTPDTMQPAAVKLFAAGVQFLRATGAATPAFTGSLAATMMGVDVKPRG